MNFGVVFDVSFDVVGVGVGVGVTLRRALRQRVLCAALLLGGCAPPVPPETAPPGKIAMAPSGGTHDGARGKMDTATFDDDVAFLRRYAEVLVLTSEEGGKVAVSPAYQGRVMTSTVTAGGPSLGFVHRAFIEKKVTGTPFDNYGGEDRFWLGPEGGPFSLYFAKGAAQTLDAWQTPAAFQEGAWHVAASSDRQVTFERDMNLTNYSGTTFQLKVVRTVRLLSQKDVARFAPLPKGASWVAFETENRIKNTGAAPWTKKTGLLSIWILGMYAPSADAKVVVPFERKASGEIVNDRYFGKVPESRLEIREKEGVLLFSCDGNYRSKIGVGPSRAKSTLGSYSPSAKLLTLVDYDKPQAVRDYVNSMWDLKQEPYAGDVVNSYNDGPPAPGKPSLGGFYEIETSSPAAALAPGAELVHTHRTLHLVGDDAALDEVAKHALGIGLADMRGRAP